MRLKDAVEYDLSQVLQYIPTVFGWRLTHTKFASNFNNLLKIRFRIIFIKDIKSWAVKDLLALEVIEEKAPRKKTPAKTILEHIKVVRHELEK
jgi:hypothetical protein